MIVSRRGGPLELQSQVLEHVPDHTRQVVVGRPPPLAPGRAVVERVGPGIGDGLPHRIDVVVETEIRDVLADLGRQLLRCEAHRRDVEGVAVHEARRIGLHDPDRGLEGVRHVHHVEPGVRPEEAGVVPVPDGLVEDFDRVVGRPPAGRRPVGDEAGEPHTAGVHSEAVEVVVAQQLAGDLGDAVHSRGPLHRLLRRVVLGSARAEGADRAGKEHGAAVLPGGLQHPVEAAHVHVPGHLRLALGHGREESRQVIDGPHPVPVDGVMEAPQVGAVDEIEGAVVAAGRHADVGGDHRRLAVALAQGVDQLRADLAQGAGDEDGSGTGSTGAFCGHGFPGWFRRSAILCARPGPGQGRFNPPRSASGARCCPGDRSDGP